MHALSSARLYHPEQYSVSQHSSQHVAHSSHNSPEYMPYHSQDTASYLLFGISNCPEVLQLGF